MPENIQVTSQKPHFMIGKSKKALSAMASGTVNVDIGQIKQFIDREPDIDLVKVIEPGGLATALAGDGLHPETILVAQMHEDRATSLKQALGESFLVERDAPFGYSIPSVLPQGVSLPVPAVTGTNNLSFTVTVQVRNEQEQPIPGAKASLFGHLGLAEGTTDENGQVTLTLRGETGQTLQGLHINPLSDYWSLWILHPTLEQDQNNLVTLRAFSQDFADFPNKQYVNWGEQAMNLHRLPSTYTGKGAKVAVIDSGAATTHHDLNGQIAGGFDYVNQNADTWNQDVVFHGTHCTGIIAGKNDDFGIRGFAPEAKVYEFKILPDGRLSNFIDALERCIELQIDVVNVSLGTDVRSELVEQRIQKAHEQGVACIVAAGNSAGPVLYPGSSPNVLTVAAIGQTGTFPESSFESTMVFTGQSNPFAAEGYFSAQFTCFGPEVSVCAPGVAILSSIPPNNFAVWNGTSMATPYVTGLAALIVAHHPDFQSQGPYATHNDQRVQRLFTIIKQSARHLELGDPFRVGAGLPDALAAFSLSPEGAPSPFGGSALQQILNEIQQIINPRTTPVGNLPAQSVTSQSIEGENVEVALPKLELLMRQARLM